MEGMTLDLVRSTGMGEQDVGEMDKNQEVKTGEAESIRNEIRGKLSKQTVKRNAVLRVLNH